MLTQGGARTPPIFKENKTKDLDILRRSPLFATLDDAAFKLLTDDITEIDLSRNAVLFYEGDPGDQLYAVLSGKTEMQPRWKRAQSSVSGGLQLCSWIYFTSRSRDSLCDCGSHGHNTW